MIAKEGVEQPVRHRAVRKAQSSRQGTELTEERQGGRNVPAAYQSGWSRVARMAPTAKRAPNVRWGGLERP